MRASSSSRNKVLLSCCTLVLASMFHYASVGGAQCKNCVDSPAAECGNMSGFHYHGGVGAFFGIIAEGGNFCHSGNLCSQSDIPCWPEFRGVARLRRVASAEEFERAIPHIRDLNLRIDASRGTLVVLGCDRRTPVLGIRMEPQELVEIERLLGMRRDLSYLYAVIESGPFLVTSATPEPKTLHLATSGGV